MVEIIQDCLKVSIVIPSRNQAMFIRETIDSVLNQEYRPIEVVIIDADSTDQTKSILSTYNKYPEIKWISEPDSGQPEGVNKGFSIATGDIIGWLNSDDVYFSRDSIRQIVNVFRVHPQADIIYGNVAIISKESRILRLYFVPAYNQARQARVNLIPQPGVFFRRRVIELEKLDMDMALILDYEYWLRLGARGFKFYHINGLIAADRQYSDRISVVHKEEAEIMARQLRDRLGIKTSHQWMWRFFDRSLQGYCRLKGFFHLVKILSDRRLDDKLAFGGKIDSAWKLGFRQLFRSITQVK